MLLMLGKTSLNTHDLFNNFVTISLNFIKCQFNLLILRIIFFNFNHPLEFFVKY
jgi:hypothetical protein